MTAAVRVGLITPEVKSMGEETLDTFTTSLVDLRQRGEDVRPQIIADGTGYAVAYRRGEGKLAYALLSETHQKRCQIAHIDGVASWGSSSSLVKTGLGILLVATDLNGDAVIYRIGHGTITPGSP